MSIETTTLFVYIVYWVLDNCLIKVLNYSNRHNWHKQIWKQTQLSTDLNRWKQKCMGVLENSLLATGVEHFVGKSRALDWGGCDVVVSEGELCFFLIWGSCQIGSPSKGHSFFPCHSLLHESLCVFILTAASSLLSIQVCCH